MPKWLLLIPTEFERGFIAPQVEKLESDLAQDVSVALCGFGPVVAAARTAALVSLRKPDHVLLLGIAGCYEELEPGNAYRFSSVGCYGVGVGTGARFQTAKQMGWSHWPGDDQTDQVSDVISTSVGQLKQSEQPPLQLLTVCASSETPADVEQRREAFPSAVAEDMEGFAVAAACQLAGLPLTIIRGISNVAGDRDKSNWKIKEAMQSAWKLAEQVTRD